MVQLRKLGFGLRIVALAFTVILLLSILPVHPLRALEFTLSGQITHDVYDEYGFAQGEAGLAGATVYYAGVSNPTLWQEMCSDDSGSYQLTFPEVGDYELAIIAPGHEVVRETIYVDSSATRDFHLNRDTVT